MLSTDICVEFFNGSKTVYKQASAYINANTLIIKRDSKIVVEHPKSSVYDWHTRRAHRR